MRLTVRGDRCTLRVEMFAQTRNNESAWNLCRRDVRPRMWPFQILASKPRRDPFDWLKELSIICALRVLRLRGHAFPHDRINRISNKKLLLKTVSNFIYVRRYTSLHTLLNLRINIEEKCSIFVKILHVLYYIKTIYNIVDIIKLAFASYIATYMYIEDISYVCTNAIFRNKKHIACINPSLT